MPVASDFGVNTTDFHHDGAEAFAHLNGYGYGANIDWVVFESNGSPRISLSTGRISGAVWSANCGWINLDDASWHVKSESILHGDDSDSDGIADAYEFELAGDLDSLKVGEDFDGDGNSDVSEFLSGSDATDPASSFEITEFSKSVAMIEISWSSSLKREYRIIHSPSLEPATWETSLDRIIPDGTGVLGFQYESLLERCFKHLLEKPAPRRNPNGADGSFASRTVDFIDVSTCILLKPAYLSP